MTTGSPNPLRVTLDRTSSGAARLAAWRDVMKLTGEVEVADPSALAAEFVTHDLGDLRTVSVRCTTYKLCRDPETAAARMLQEQVFVNLVEAGVIRGRLAGRRICVEAGDVLLSRSASRMDVVLEDAWWLGCLLPRSLLEARMPWRADLDALVFPKGSVEASLLGNLVKSLCGLPAGLSRSDAALATSACLALLVACLARTPDAPGSQQIHDAELARTVRRFILRRLSDPELNVALICREFGLSRSALYRLLEESGQVASVIRRLRLQMAVRELTLSSDLQRSLVDVARACGFRDESTFRRAFMREFGSTPSVFRERGEAEVFGPVVRGLEPWFQGL